MKPSTDQSSDFSKIETILKHRIEAIKSQDIENAVSNYAENVLLFDVVGPLQKTGAQVAKQRLEEWLSAMESPVGYEVSHINIKASDTIAFCSSLNHVLSTKIDGSKLDMWWRETLCFEKKNDNWVIVQVHSSVPMDPESGKASVTLKPDDKIE